MPKQLLNLCSEVYLWTQLSQHSCRQSEFKHWRTWYTSTEHELKCHVENTRWNYCFQSGPPFLPLLRLLTSFRTSALLSLRLHSRAYIPSLLNPGSLEYGLPLLNLFLKHAYCKYRYTSGILHSTLHPCTTELPSQTRVHHRLNFHSKV